MLDEVGQVDQAVGTMDEAVDLWRVLAEEHEYHRSSLASAQQAQRGLRRRAGHESESVGKL